MTIWIEEYKKGFVVRSFPEHIVTKYNKELAEAGGLLNGRLTDQVSGQMFLGYIISKKAKPEVDKLVERFNGLETPCDNKPPLEFEKQLADTQLVQ